MRMLAPINQLFNDESMDSMDHMIKLVMARYLTLKLLNIFEFSAPLCWIFLKKILQYVDVLLNNHQNFNN